jgi:hypothetical protein
MGVFGYIFGAGFVFSGIAKCLFPAHTGMWVINGEIVASGTQFYVPQPPAHEILGVWYIPIALILGSVILMCTTWAIRNCLRISRNRQSKL